MIARSIDTYWRNGNRGTHTYIERELHESAITKQRLQMSHASRRDDIVLHHRASAISSRDAHSSKTTQGHLTTHSQVQLLEMLQARQRAKEHRHRSISHLATLGEVAAVICSQ